MEYRRKKFLMVPFVAAALVLAVASVAYGCTLFMGKFSVTGNASNSGTVTCRGLDRTMENVCDAGIARVTSTGSITVSTDAVEGTGSKLPPGSYDINFYRAASQTSSSGYYGHVWWNTDCMTGSAGTNIGSVTVGANGQSSGGPFNIPTSGITNGQLWQISPVFEAAACISDSTATYGNQAPVTVA